VGLRSDYLLRGSEESPKSWVRIPPGPPTFLLDRLKLETPALFPNHNGNVLTVGPKGPSLSVQFVFLTFSSSEETMTYLIVAVASNEASPMHFPKTWRFVVELGNLKHEGILLLPLSLAIFDETVRPHPLVDVLPGF
jgi:hypothetical protein